ncbi:MAG: flippase-like domain-containing protein [Candidatus Omnitrophica bacterium]|nr:flippase-like domain-containing protein [Candidatus Omnitrophota bacterium]MCB9719776.1 flippase-like domain-containing protein [Candidatus Omnitrophota bacterium]
MKKIIINILKLCFGLGIIVYLLSRIDRQALLETVREMEVRYLWGVFAFFVSVIYLSTLRWHILLKRFSDRVPFTESMKWTFLSHFFNTFLPGNVVGDVLRGVKIKNKDIGYSEGLASSVLDRVCGLMTFMGMAVFGIIVGFNVLDNRLILYVAAAFIAAGSAVFFLVQHEELLDRLRPFAKLYAFVSAKLEKFIKSLQYYKHEKKFFVAAMWISLAMSVLNCLGFYLIATGLGGKVPAIYFLLFIPIVNIISHVPVTHAGLGLREGIFVYIFTQMGLSEPEALGTSLIFYASVLVMGAAQGVGYYLIHLSEEAGMAKHRMNVI